MGSRPENIHDEEVFLANAETSVISAKVEVVELMGSETYLYLKTSGKDENIVARVDPRSSARTGDTTSTVIASTASPFKFCRAVAEALGGTIEIDDVTQLDILSDLTGAQPPKTLADLRDKTPRFDRVVEKEEILSTVELLKQM